MQKPPIVVDIVKWNTFTERVALMAISQTLEEFENYFTNFLAKLGFNDVVTTLELKPYAADGDTLSISMPLKDEIAQASGMYSAALFGAADIAGTLLAMQMYTDSGMFPPGSAVQPKFHE